MTPEPKAPWGVFAQAIAEIADVPVNTIEERTYLINDLGLDSIALAEVVVLLMVDFEMQALAEDLEERDWQHATVGDLYEEYQTGVARRTQTHTIRMPN